MNITPKQARFVEEYLIDLCATQAAIRAGYSKHTAKSQGQRLLTNVDIQAAVQKGQAAIAERNGVTLDWLIAEFKKNHALAREGNPVLDRYGNHRRRDRGAAPGDRVRGPRAALAGA